MSYGVPVIALKIHGASIVLDDSCSILVEVINKQQMISDFRDAILKLCRNPMLRIKMGEAGKKRVSQNYLWEKRGEKMNLIYRDILSKENKRSKEKSLHE
jgi:glycosyltransferase involved in cell wall biosynthesis